jgi:hypothetical protein
MRAARARSEPLRHGLGAYDKSPEVGGHVDSTAATACGIVAAYTETGDLSGVRGRRPPFI